MAISSSSLSSFMVFFAAALACASVAGFSGLDPPLHRPPPRPCTGRRSSTQPVWLGTSSSSTATVPPPKSTTPATTSIVALESNEIATNNSSVYGLPMPADGGSGSGGNDDTGTAAVFPESVVAQSIITVQPPSKRVKNDFESDAAFTTPIPSTAAVVVWINRNARGVTERTIQVARSVFGDDAVLVTTSAKDQAAAAQIILERLKPRILIPVGGDGTLTSIISSLCGCSPTDVVDGDDASNTRLNDAVRNLPILAYIPLGTGNAVGSVVGCRIAAKKSSFFSIAATALGFSGRRRTNRTKIETKNKNNDLRSVLVRIQSMAANYENDAAAATGLFDSQSATMPPTTPLRTAGIPIVELPILQVTTTTTTTTMTQSTASAAPSKTTSSALCFFAGVGFDSLMLDDFKEIKAWSQRTGILTRVLSSVAGYCVALIVKTLPKTIAHSSHQVNVRVTTNRPSETLWVDHRRGDFVQRISCPTSTTNASSTPPGCRTAPGTSPPAQTILFEGETGILAAGTAPYYGGGLRLFPFARMTIDKMHLRIGRIHPVTGFFKIPAIFAGSYRDKSDRFGVLDFLGTDFGVQILPKSNSDTTDQMSGFPLQHSGESVGSVDSIQLRVIEQPIRFLNLLKER